MLERVIECLGVQFPKAEVQEIMNVKFLHLLKPEQVFNIHTQKRPGEAIFECRMGEILLSKGKLKLIHTGSSR